MRLNYIIAFFLFLIGISGTKLYCQVHENSPSKDYIEILEDARKGTNIEFMYSEKSPLAPDQKKGFQGLDYFSIDGKYRVEGLLVKDENPDTVIMKTSGSRTPKYIKYGVVKFEVDGIEQQLSVFQYIKLLDQPNQEQHLFIPFRDETTSLETYGGGRYIDCEIPEEGSPLILDFNKAYNPYCAYNHKYSCVLPPDENQLSVRIEAGEKVFEE
ncbi:MAG: hypothetical protein DRJ05_19945 [Bacteroidetes bacterium]|nr:MAG: hypothetical protein DRJ05_19945 [Bacteroidota bacterium]